MLQDYAHSCQIWYMFLHQWFDKMMFCQREPFAVLVHSDIIDVLKNAKSEPLMSQVLIYEPTQKTGIVVVHICRGQTTWLQLKPIVKSFRIHRLQLPYYSMGKSLAQILTCLPPFVPSHQDISKGSTSSSACPKITDVKLISWELQDIHKVR